MSDIARKAMQLTRSQCRTSLHYCFACLESFEPSEGKTCPTCHWLGCPSCGACYCSLDSKARTEVDDFYSSHCAGEGCPYGKGGGPYVPYARMPARDVIQREVGAPRQPDLSTADKLESVSQESQRAMDRGKGQIDRFLNDHSFDHVQRVKEIMDDVEMALESSSFAQRTLGRIPSDQDLLAPKAGVFAHDVGYVKDSGRHAEYSADFVRTNNALKLEDGERNEVANLCLLHSREAARQTFGTDDISELVRSGMISRETAYKASLVRFADALDAGQERVQRNSQGVPREQIMREVEKLPGWESDMYMSHWHGHQGFRQPNLINKEGQLTLEVAFLSDGLRSHGTDVAFMVRNLLRDTNSTLIGRDIRLRLTCDDSEALKEWFDANRMILSHELRQVKTCRIESDESLRGGDKR